MIIERLTSEHILSVQLQPAQSFIMGLVTPEYAQAIASQKGVGWAATEYGKTIGCGGIAEAWSHRGIAWMMLSDDAFRHFVPIHRLVKRVLAEAPFKRIEMTVDSTHTAGARWASRLGFECEGLMRSYTQDGRDCFLYAKVK